jgi:uncharacterized membrane protein (DUF106 family)
MARTSNSAKQNSSKQKSAKKKLSITARVLYGDVISSEFFSKHWIGIFCLAVLVLIYISTKYQCLTSMETIKKLESELEVAKTERIRERSTYMSRIRESSMQELVDSVMPGLSVQEQPPYQLSNSDDE